MQRPQIGPPQLSSSHGHSMKLHVLGAAPLLISLFFGCSSSKNSSVQESGTPRDSGLPGDAAVSSLSLSIGPISLDAGEERTVCKRFRLPNATVLQVTKLDAILAPGSHHLVFYRSVATDETTDLYDCPALDPSDGRAAPPSGGFPDQDVPIYIAETTTHNALALPDGVAYKFEAGQMVRLEAHYLNASASPIEGQGSVTLTLGNGTDYVPADIMFCGSVQPLLPAAYSNARLPGLTGAPPYGLAPGQETTLPWQFMTPPSGVHIFALTSHQHKQGTGMRIEKATDADTAGAQLVNSPNWDDPEFAKFDGEPLTFSGNEGLRWQCKYTNTGSDPIYFGQSAQTNEMCFFWAYYYPSVGSFISLGFPQCWQ